MINQLLNNALKKAKVLPFDKGSRYILFSDLHKGDNSYADDFAKNMLIYKEALHHYYINDFTYIELGDGIELWENRKIAPIIKSHQVIFDLLKAFHDKNRLHLLYGNHDMIMMYPFMVKKLLGSIFTDLKYDESILLTAKNPKHNILLVHGHQADYMNYLFWWFHRFLVRYVWKPLQLFGIKDPTSPAKNYKGRIKLERRMEEWIIKNDNQPVIFGHTHRPRFPKFHPPTPSQKKGEFDSYKKDAPMFNTGSCVHPDAIIGIEIENMKICMVKWVVDDDGKGMKRIVLEAPVLLEEYWHCDSAQ